MGLATPHSLGRNQRCYVVRESAFGTYIRPSGSSALKVTKSSMDSTIERIKRRDASQTASTTEGITGRRTASWSVDSYAMGSGTAGTPPDIHDLLYAWFGTYTNTPSTSDAYTIADSQTARGSVSLTREYNSIFAQGMAGCLVESFKFAYSGTSLPMWTFDGPGADLYYTGYSTLNGALSGGETSIVVQTAAQDNFMVGSVISVGTSNNSGGSPPGHIVTAKSGATLTITPAVTGAQSDGAVVAPYVPTESTAGSPVSHVLATAALDGATLPVTSFELTGKNNFKVHDDEAGSAIITDATPGWRDVTGSISLRARRDQILHLGKWRNSVATIRDLQVVCGTAAGSIITFDLNRIEVENPKFDSPEADECMITLPFWARGSSGADELSVTFT